MTINDVFFLAVILMSAVFHEYMHGWAALQMGDHTAKDLGRLTLNPVVHIDPFMTILLPAMMFFATGGQFMFAAAKPVPFNPYNLRYPRFGPALVGLAGPSGNFLIAIIFGLLLRLNLLPAVLIEPAFIIILANISLGVFNLVPIPPLDGSHILEALFPARLGWLADTYARYGYILFIVFLLFFSSAIFPIVLWLTRFIAGPLI